MKQGDRRSVKARHVQKVTKPGEGKAVNVRIGGDRKVISHM